MTSDKVKLKIKNQDTLHTENARYKVLHKKIVSMPLSRSTQKSRANKF